MAAMQTLAYDSLRKNPEKVEECSNNSVLYNCFLVNLSINCIRIKATLSKTLEKRRNVMFIL
ncbi:hypothetical protein BACFRA24663_01860 [Bacteroides fragilis]